MCGKATTANSFPSKAPFSIALAILYEFVFLEHRMKRLSIIRIDTWR